MRKVFFAVCIGFLCCSSLTNAQVFNGSNAELSKIANQSNNSGWITFRDDVAIEVSSVFSVYKSGFGLSSNDEMISYRSETDKLGYTHTRYHQTYQDIPVLGADYILHSQNGIAKTGNGKLIQGLSISTNATINKAQAIQAAIGFVGAQKYMWEDASNEEMLKHITGNATATYYPESELVIVDKKYSGIASNYRLAWKVNVYAEQPLSYQDIYIDAQTGSVFHIINRILNDDVNGVAVTKYSGTQNIITDSTGIGQYRLRETGRGNGIETYDMNEGTNYGAAVDFTDTDNNWNNVNAQKDEVATDAHWGAEMTYDYFLNVHNRHSYDDLDSKLVSYVHYDVAYANASWDGTRMTYGDGGGTEGPFTALDVCGHEIAHGVTQYTADLVYQDEPGALNESFSDMFGAAVEFYALNGAGDWFVGEDFDLSGGNGFRDMSDPKSDQQPDTYLGQYWYIGSIDQGGVHTNSGVANYWFYLMSEGGSGTNDLGQTYSVNAVSLDTAEQIAYRALSIYLTTNSQYSDARMATLQAAADLYGPCSEVYIQCANAWYAVGVGMAIADFDLFMMDATSPETACGMSNETVTVRALYNGCNVPIPSGDTILFYYNIDAGPVVQDSLILSSDINAGDTITFSFNTLADVSAIGFHSIDAWLSYTSDTLYYNDTLSNYTFENRLYQNVDLGVTKITEPVSSCNLSSTETVSVQIEFYGCDFLPAGDSIPLSFTVNGGSSVYDTLVLTNDLYPGVPLDFSFTPTADLSLSDTYTLIAQTELLADTMYSNDASAINVKKPLILSDTTITFEESNVNDFFLIHTTPYSHAFVSTAAEHTGARGFLMTGGNPMQYLSMIEFPTGTNNWQINEFLSAKIDFCIDATDWATANLMFDLKQTYGETLYNIYLGAGDYSAASNFRILVDGTNQIGSTYNPSSGNTDPYSARFVNLSAYAGTMFTLTFETRNIAKDTLGFTMDNAFIDNVSFSEESQFDIEEQQVYGDLNLYPNPSDGRFWLDYPSKQSDEIVVEVFDYTGRKVFVSSYQVISGTNKLLINMGKQAEGIYVVRTFSGSESHIGRVICE